MSEQTRTTIYLRQEDRERLQRLSRYGLGTSAAVRAGLALLEQQMRGRRTMDDWRMTTDDRNEQINYLRDVGRGLGFGYGKEGTPQEQVEYWEQTHELPEWYDAHDRAWLINWLTTE